ncbi:MAG TPA: glycosyltransferase family 4 protein [Tepidisphaeraceae bacterium]|nr:glycosyltransferase family 4 protein [Tepidisphaeraceae bacterium]
MRHTFEPGGIASYIQRVAAAQIAAGHAVTFFDRTDPAAVRLHPHPDGHPVTYTADDADLFARARDSNLDVLHLHTTIDPAALPDSHSAPRLIRTVHTHTPYCPSQGRFLARPGAPCDRAYSLAGCLAGHLVNRCGSVRFATLRKNFRTTRHERATLPHIPTVVVSDFLKQEMTRAGYPADRITVLHLPAPDTGPSSPLPLTPSSPPKFLFLGRMIPHKGVDWLLRSLHQVKSDVLIELGGAGGHEATYRDLAQRHNLSGRVRFLGWLAPEQVAEHLRAARALVFPSLWHEPGGTVAFEAMAHARPVIVSRVGGMPEVVADGVTGLTVPPGDEAALARAIDLLAINEPLARQMGEAGQARAREHHSMDRHLASLMNVYAGIPA